MLGILKAGGAYLPLDPHYPEARLAYMLADAAPALVLTSGVLRARLSETIKVLTLDAIETQATLSLAPAHNPSEAERSAPLLSQHPAYVIYTSGSSGAPKGVVVTHAGIASLAGAQVERLGLSRQSRVLQFASLNFDASLWELVMALTTGARLVLLREESAGAARRCARCCLSQQVTHATLPPVVLATLEEGEDLALKSLIVAGDSLPGGAGRPLVAGPVHDQCLRPDGDNGVRDDECSAPGSEATADRLAYLEHAGVCAGCGAWSRCRLG